MKLSKEKLLIYLALFSSLVLIVLTKQVFFISLSMVLFEKCFFARINPLPFGGIELTTLATILVTLKYGLGIGLLFVFLVFFLPGIVNIFLEYKMVINPSFSPFSIGIGPFIDALSVVIIYLLRGYDILFITFIVVLVKNTLGKIGGFSPQDMISIPINFLFNLALVYYTKPYLLLLLH